MNQETIIYLAREALLTVLIVAGPVLGGSLLVGLLISIFQASTQIQEQTLSFVPKIIAVLAVVVFFGAWMLNTLLAFTNNLFMNMNSYIK